MAAPGRAWAADLLHVWFHTLRPDDWFAPDDRVDAMLRRRFGDVWAAMRSQPAATFATDPLTARAAILLFDQVPRNIWRGSDKAFASDPLARRIAKVAIERGWDRMITTKERSFIGMPLMHSEDIADQRASLAFFVRSPANRAFARAHWAMIARFGRFPHRNAVLGRRSTPAERAAIAAGNAW